jgi:hypothetical protein
LWRRGDMLLKEIKVKVLKEGFEDLLTDHNVEVTSRTAEFETEFKEITTPLHRRQRHDMDGCPTYSYRDTRLALQPTRSKQLLFPDRTELVGSQLKRHSMP